jgi:uncharacterized protein YgiM (DUF1202 family)
MITAIIWQTGDAVWISGFNLIMNGEAGTVIDSSESGYWAQVIFENGNQYWYKSTELIRATV